MKAAYRGVKQCMIAAETEKRAVGKRMRFPAAFCLAEISKGQVK